MTPANPLFAIPINEAAPWLCDAWDFLLNTREKMYFLNSANVREPPSLTFNQFSHAQQVAIYDAMQRAVIWGESLRQMLFGAQFMAQKARTEPEHYRVGGNAAA